MNRDEERLCQTLDQMGRMYHALLALREEVLPVNSRQFAMMAEGPVAEMQHLVRQLDECIETIVTDAMHDEPMEVIP